MAFRRVAAALVATVLAVLLVPRTAGAEDIRSQEWEMSTLSYQQAWKYSTGAGVEVAVLDSGVDADHPDLSGKVLSGIDLVDGSTDGRKDFVGHGTSVADLIAGHRSGDGVAGLAYESTILPVRVLDANNRYDDAQIIASGVRWAVDHGAQVINVSLGGAAYSRPLADALHYAFVHNVVVVACAGNVEDHAGKGVWYPGRAPGVIAVSGLDPDGTFWPGSVSGPQVALSAPANGLIGARPGGYWHVQGTSFAAPLVTATAALIRAKWPNMSAANVVNRLIRTSDDLGPAGRDPRYGYGEVDPVKALTASVPGVSANPLDTRSPSRDSAGGAGAAQSPTTVAAAPASQSQPYNALLIALAVIMLILVAAILVLLLRHTQTHNHYPRR